MFGKVLLTLFSILISLSWMGCARPKYVQESTDSNNGSFEQGTKANCSITFSQSHLCLSWYWEQKPTSKEMGSLIFKTYRLNTFDQTSVPVDMPIVPTLVLWMPGMGHGSTPTQTTRLDVGTYRASRVFFIMPGEWNLQFQVQNGNDVTDEAKVSFTF